MNGLFYRLAQQAINQRDTSVKPVRTPVFSTEFTGALDHVDDRHQESVQASIFSEPLRPSEQPSLQRTEDANNETRSDVSVHASSRPLSTTPYLVSAHTARKDREAKSNLSIGASEQDIVTDNETLEASTIQPQIQSQTVTVSRNKSSWRSTDKDVNPKRFQPSTHDFSVAPSQSLVTPISKKYSTMVTRHNIRTQSSEINRQQTDSQSTTINVSIGQIDIKAISSEAPALKKTHQSNRKPSISLENYQKKRQRGER